MLGQPLPRLIRQYRCAPMRMSGCTVIARRNRKVKGFTVYYFRWGSRRLAKCMNQAFVTALPDHPNMGIHRRTFVSVTSAMPTVLLEMGFLTNKIEVKDLASDSYQSPLVPGDFRRTRKLFCHNAQKNPFMTALKRNNSHTYSKTYGVIVVGAGHAGCEAALAAARLGAFLRCS